MKFSFINGPKRKFRCVFSFERGVFATGNYMHWQNTKLTKSKAALTLYATISKFSNFLSHVFTGHWGLDIEQPTILRYQIQDMKKEPRLF